MSAASHEAQKGEFERCLLLYSGGLDTSALLKMIGEKYDAKVVACTIDIGQIHEDLEATRQKALDLGAADALTIDCKAEFADGLLAEAVVMNADYEGGYHLSTPLGRVAIARAAVRAAKQTGCTVVAHGCTGKGNDQVRFESYITTLAPELKTLAPVRTFSLGRDELLAYAEKNGIPVKQKAGKNYSYDDNMWGSTAEGGEIEDPAQIPPLEKILAVCTHPEQAPEQAEDVQIRFEQGRPVAWNGQAMPLDALIERANEVGARHGVGITQLIEDRLIGLKVRGVYEAPAAEVLIAAHQNLERLVLTRDAVLWKQHLDLEWGARVYEARYFEPTTGAMHAAGKFLNQRVSGTATVRLHRGRAVCVAADSDYSLFDANLATFDANAAFNTGASPGFIELHSLAQRTFARVSPVDQTGDAS